MAEIYVVTTCPCVAKTRLENLFNAFLLFFVLSISLDEFLAKL